MRGFRLAHVVLLSFTLLNCACNNSGISEQFIDLGKNGILPCVNYDFQPFEERGNSFSPDICDIDILIRYNDTCPVRDLILDYETIDLQNDTLIFGNVNIHLFDNKDSSFNKGNFGICETKIPVLKNWKVDQSFFITLSSLTNAQGIMSIGIVCTET